jgi:hypothetical protein
MNLAKLGGNDNVDLGIVIISWNVKDLLIQNLTALLESHGTTCQIIVVDNASSDGTVEEVRQRFPEIDVIANHENLGFAKAVNQGLREMHARHALLLNPDMLVEPEALEKTVAYLDAHPDVAVVGGRLASPGGQIVKSVRRFPDIWSQFAILLKLPHLFPHILDHYLWNDFDYTQEQAVDSVRGSYFAINGQALRELGRLDERYFIWFEEVDYCKLAVTNSWKVMYAPSIRAIDLVGRSFAQRQTLWKQKQFTRSMIQYFEKWHSGWRVLLLRFVRPFGLALAWLADRF